MAASSSLASSLSALADVLKREQRRGVPFRGIQPESEEILRRLPMDFMARKSKAPQTVAGSALPTADEPKPVGSAPVSETSERTEEWARAELNKIFRDVKSSQILKDLGTLRETIVFATGNPLADLMFVGEAPGAQEEEERKPFVGPAGQKLTQIITAMGLSRNDVYISNIVKFRPKKGDGRFQGTSNRKPDATEMAASMEYVRREIAVVQPKVIVALGGTAAEGLLDAGGSVTSMRNKVHDFEGIPLIVSYHPSYVLRQEADRGNAGAKATKRAVWEDMLKAMEILGMPISDKQRGFFA